MADITASQIGKLVPQQGDGSRELLTRLVRGNALRFNAPSRFTILASAARTVSTSSAVFNSDGAIGVAVWLNVTAASGTGGLNVFIQAIDEAGNGLQISGASLNPPMTITGQGLVLLKPGACSSMRTSGTFTSGFSAGLTQQFRVLVSHADASSYTYEVKGELLYA